MGCILQSNTSSPHVRKVAGLPQRESFLECHRDLGNPRFSCVDEDNLGFSFVSSFGFGGRAEENVHSLYFKNTSTFKKTNTRSKGKGREKIIFKIIKHKNPGAYYIIKYVFKKNPQTIIHTFMNQLNTLHLLGTRISLLC